MNLKKYKHIIWDWNGTLFEDVDLCCSIMNGILSRRNMSRITFEKYKEVFTFPVIEYYKRVGLDVSGKNWEILSNEFIDEYEARKDECGLYEKAIDILELFKSKGIKQSVLSAYSQHTLEEMINRFELSQYFIRLVGLDNIYAASKLENGILWMNELGHSEGEVLLIGDTVHDCEVANHIKADSLLISNGHQTKNELLKCNAVLVDNLKELLNVFES
ncbi:MAG: HAD family hydrolase [Ignavibacteriae bacterium HGW-Ignavibacteriae-2]|jgi:phosphoglycolate phosphatase|nr:MAG: HAD family hydrolase [Ignavibacteriae bacterium HGW-Ignavibacteriae-2]